MTSKKAIFHMNADHLTKILFFNALMPADQKELAGAPDFWREHNCRRYSVDGRCLECGKVLPRSPVSSPSLLSGFSR